MRTLGMKPGEAIQHPWMTKAVETSQKKVEQRNFDIRKNILKYDDVMNDQRKAIFEQRIEFMTAEDVSDVIKDMRTQAVEDLVERRIPPKAYADQWDVDGLDEDVKKYFALELPVKDWAAEEGIADEEIRERLMSEVDKAYAEKAADIGPELMRRVEKQVLLQTIDGNWREHLQQLDALRSMVGLRGYAQRDPLNEFKTEAFSLFETLLDELRFETTRKKSRPGTSTPRPDATKWLTPARSVPTRRPPRARLRRGLIRKTRKPGAACRATPPARADRARSSSTATARSARRRAYSGVRRGDLVLRQAPAAPV